MKIDWKKDDKAFYLPKNKPELVEVPEFKYFTICGEGNPNDPLFGEYISALYSLSYAIKMSPKQKWAPDTYNEYKVYPLEGVWDLSEEGKREFAGYLDKGKLAFTLMIRQPDFVTGEFAQEALERTKKKNANRFLDEVRFEALADGKCIQMLHIGSYDAEPASFRIMGEYASELHLERKGGAHKEIYLSDPKRVDKDELRTVLRFMVK